MPKSSAKEYYENMLALHGEDHYETLFAYCKMLAEDVRGEGFEEKVFDIEDKIACLRQSTDPEAYGVMIYYASLLECVLDHPAIGEYEETYKWVKSLADAGEKLMASIQCELLDAYDELEFYDEAEEIGEELCNRLKSDEKTERQKYIFWSIVRAKASFRNEKYEKAFLILDEIYRDEKETLSAEKRMYADLCYNMAACCLYLKNFERAEELSEKAAELYADSDLKSSRLADFAKSLNAKIKKLKTYGNEAKIGGFLILNYSSIWLC